MVAGQVGGTASDDARELQQGLVQLPQVLRIASARRALGQRFDAHGRPLAQVDTWLQHDDAIFNAASKDHMFAPLNPL